MTYIVKVVIRKSTIDGDGVFAEEKIPKGKIVWRYDEGKDSAISRGQFETLSQEQKEHYLHSAYLSPWSGLWICPPDGEAGNFTNHSRDNNTSVRYDEKVSSEPYFVATRDIPAGEEITNNYHEFDEMTKSMKPEWAK